MNARRPGNAKVAMCLVEPAFKRYRLGGRGALETKRYLNVEPREWYGMDPCTLR